MWLICQAHCNAPRDDWTDARISEVRHDTRAERPCSENSLKMLVKQSECLDQFDAERCMSQDS